jgi:hypothetical protein
MLQENKEHEGAASLKYYMFRDWMPFWVKKPKVEYCVCGETEIIFAYLSFLLQFYLLYTKRGVEILTVVLTLNLTV